MTTLFKDQIVWETYGETIAVGDVLYKSTGTGNDVGRTAGRLYKLDMTNDDRKVFYGIAKEAGAAADTNKKVVTGGRFDGYSGLTPGQVVYADTTTPGAITQTLPRPAQAIGIAIDADSISVNAALGGSLSQGTGAGTGTLNLLEDPSFEFDDAEGSITGGTASLNSVTVLPTPNNARSLELNFNNVTGSYILEKNTGAQYDSVQGLVSVWIKNAKSGVKLIPRINGADSTALSVDVKTDNKWNEYVIPAVIGTTSFGFKIDVTASNAGSLFIDEATVGAMPATMTPEVAQAEYFGGLTANAAANCVWSTTSTSFANFAADADCNEFTEIGNIKKPSTKIPALIIPAGSPSGVYHIIPRFYFARITPGLAYQCFFRMTDGVSFSSSSNIYLNNTGDMGGGEGQHWSYNYTTSSTDTAIQFQSATNNASGGCGLVLNSSASGDNSGFDVYYYPPKSKIYSNKSMGWYVDVNIGGDNPSLGTSNVSTYTSISNAGLDMVINPGSQPAQIPCSGTNPSTGTTCSAGDEQVGVVFDIPSVGTYEVCVEFQHFVRANAAGLQGAEATFQLVETSNNGQAILQEGKSRITSAAFNSSGTDTFSISPNIRCATFIFNSVGRKTVRLMYEQSIAGVPIANSILADRNSIVGQRDIHITVKPFINNEQITASFKQIDDELEEVYVYAHSSSSSIGTSNSTMVFSTEVNDNKNAYNNSTGVFTAPKDGIYHISSAVQTASVVLPTTDRYVCSVLHNGSNHLGSREVGSGGSNQYIANINIPIKMTQGQTAQIQCLSGVATSAVNSLVGTWLRIARIPSK